MAVEPVITPSVAGRTPATLALAAVHFWAKLWFNTASAVASLLADLKALVVLSIVTASQYQPGPIVVALTVASIAPVEVVLWAPLAISFAPAEL